MNNPIDIRTIEMRFNNAAFEKGIKETLRSLDLFDKSLNAIGTGIELASVVKVFDGIINKARQFGNIVNNVIDGINSKISSMFRSFTGIINQTSAGMEKYQSLMNATRTMMNATGKSVEEINEIMVDLNDYTDMTSYSFSDLVSNMSSIVSSGAVKDLKTAEAVMEGMANASAHAGIGIQQAAWPMQTLVKAMSSGKMSADKWDSLSLSQFITPQLINQFVEAAKEVGTLDKEGNLLANGKKIKITAQNIKDTLHYGWINADVMSKTFQVYADGEKGIGKAAYNAAKEARTFTDVIESLKDAISTGWMKSFQYLFGNVEQAAQFFTWMADAFIGVSSSISELRNEILSGWNEKGGRDSFIDSIIYAWETISEIGEMVTTAFTNIFELPSAESFLDLTKKIHDAIYDVYMWLGKDANEGRGGPIAPRFVLIRQAFEGLFSALSFGKDVVSGFFGVVWKAVSTIFGSSDSFLLTIGQLGRELRAFFDTVRKNGNVAKFFSDIWTTIEPLAVALKNLANAVFNTVGAFLGLDKSAEKSAFVDKFRKRIQPFVDWFNAVIGKVVGFINKLSYYINMLATAKDFKVFANLLSWAWSMIKRDLKGLLKGILDTTINALKGFWPSIKEHLDTIKNSLVSWILGKSKDVKDSASGFFDGYLDSFSKSFEKLKKEIPNWFKDIRAAIAVKWPELDAFIVSIGNAVTSIWNMIKSVTGLDQFLKKDAKGKKDSVFGALSSGASTTLTFFTAFLNIISEVTNIISPLLKSVVGLGAAFKSSAISIMKLLGLFDKETYEPLIKFANETVGKIVGFIDQISRYLRYLSNARDLDDLVGRLSWFWKSIKREAIVNLKKIGKSITDWLQSFLPGFTGRVVNKLSTFKNTIATFFTDLRSSIATKWPELDKLLIAIEKVSTSIWNFITSVTGLDEFFKIDKKDQKDAVWNAISNGINTAIKLLTVFFNVAGDVIDTVSPLFKAVIDLGKAFWNLGKTLFSMFGLLDGGDNFISEKLKPIVDAIKTFVDFITGIVNYIAGAKNKEELQERLTLAFTAIGLLIVGFIKTTFDSVVDFINKEFPKVIESVKKWYKSIRASIAKKWPELDSLLTSIENIASSIWNFIKSVTGLDRFLGKSQEEQKNTIWSSISDGVSKASTILSKFLDIISEVVDALSPVFVAVVDLGKAVWSFISTLGKLFGIFDENSKDKVGKKLKPIIDAVTNFVKVITGVFNYLADAKSIDDLKNRLVILLTGIGLLIASVFIKIKDSIVNWFKTEFPKVRDSIFNSVKEYAPKVLDYLEKTFPKTTAFVKRIIDWFNTTFPGISNAIRSFFTNTETSIVNGWDWTQTTIGGIISEIRDWIVDKINWFTSFIGGLSLGDKDSNPIANFMTNLFSSGKDKLNGAKDTAINLVSGIGNGISDFGGNAVDAMGNLVTDIIDKAKEIAEIHSPSLVMMDVGKFLAIGVAEGIKKYTPKAESASEGMTKDILSKLSVDNFGKAEIGIVEYANNVADTLSSVGNGNISGVQNAESFFSIIRDALYAIKDIVFAIIDVVKGLLSGIQWLLDHPMATLFIGLLIVITIVVTSISNIYLTLGRLKGVTAPQSTTFRTLFAFGISLSAIIFAIAALNAVATPGEILMSVGSILLIVAATAGLAIGIDAFANATKRLGVNDALSKMQGLLMSMAGLIVSVVLLAPALLIFASIPLKTFVNGGIKMVAIFGALALVLAVANSLSGGGSDGWSGFVGLAAGVIIMVGAFVLMYKALENVKVEIAVGALAAISVLAIALGAAAGFAKEAKPGVFFALAVVMYTVILLFEALNNASKTLGGAIQTDALMVLLSLLVLSIGKVLKDASKIDKKSIGSVSSAFIAIGAMAYLIGLSIEKVKDVPWQASVPMLAGITLIVFVVSNLVKSMKKVTANQILGLSVLMVGVGVLALATAYAVGLVKDVAWETAIVFMAGLSLVLVAMSAIPNSAKNVSFSQLAGVAILMAGVALIAVTLGFALSFVKDVPWQTALVFIGGLLALTITLALISKLADNVNIVALAKLAAGIIVFVGILAIGLAVIALVVSLIGNVIAGSLKSMFEQLSEALFSLGSGLADFQAMTADVDPEKVRSILALVGDIVTKIGELAGVNYPSVDDFRTAIFGLGSNLQGFNMRLAAIDRKKIQEKLKIVDDIKSAADKMSKITNIGDMSNTIVNIGGAIKLYYESLNGVDMVPKDSQGNPIDTSKIDTQGIASMFHSIAEQMPDSKDLANVGIYADNSEGTALNNFAVGITNLGTALSTFANDVGKVNQTDVDNGIASLGKFSDIQQNLPYTEFEAFEGFFKGKKQSLTGFGADIEAVGSALSDFGTKMSGAIKVMDEDTGQTNIDAGIEAAKKMADLGNALPTRQNALFAWFTGKQMSLSEFGSNMSTLGHGVHNFVVNAFADGVTYDKTQIEAVAECVSTFVDIQNKIVKKEAGNALENFATYLANAGTGIKNFNNNAMFDDKGNAVKYDVEKLKAISEVVDIFVGIQNKIVKKEEGNAINDFAKWLNESSSKFKSFFESASKWSVNTESLKAMGEMAGGIAEAFGKGFGDGASEAIEDYSSSKITGSISNIISDVKESFGPEGELYQDMVACGHYIDLGLEKGIREYGYKPANAIESVGGAINKRIRSVVMVKSPSKLMEEIGMYIDLGLEHGIMNYSDSAVNAADFMANGVVEAIRDATDVHSESPTIRDIGEWVAKSFQNGMNSLFPDISLDVENGFGGILEAFKNGIGDISKFLRGEGSLQDILTNTFHLDSSKVTDVLDMFKTGDYAGVISELTGLGMDMDSISSLFGINANDFVEGTSFTDMLKNIFGFGHTTLEADEVNVDKVGTLGGDTSGDSKLGGKSTSGRSASSESSNLGKQTTTVSSGGLNLSMTEGYTIGDILNRIDRLETAITNMRIVMDTGVLAGQVASGVDKELGNYATLNGRWN